MIIKKIVAVALAFSVMSSASALAAQDITIMALGEQLETDTPPVIESDRVFVPIRAVGEALGAQIGWDGATGKIVFIKNATINTLFVGGVIAYKSYKGSMSKIELDAAPFIRKNRAFAPLRYIAESFDYDVEWDETAKTVTISLPEKEDIFSEPEYPEIAEPEMDYEWMDKRNVEFDDANPFKQALHTSARYVFERYTLPAEVKNAIYVKLSDNNYDGVKNAVDNIWRETVKQTAVDEAARFELNFETDSLEELQDNMDYYELNPDDIYDMTMEYIDDETVLALLNMSLIDSEGSSSFIAFTNEVSATPNYFIVSLKTKGDAPTYGFYRFDGAVMRFVKDIDNDAHAMIAAIKEELAIEA
jgi:hypothetical protein